MSTEADQDEREHREMEERIDRGRAAAAERVLDEVNESALTEAAKDVLTVFAADVPGSRALWNLYRCVYGNDHAA